MNFESLNWYLCSKKSYIEGFVLSFEESLLGFGPDYQMSVGIGQLGRKSRPRGNGGDDVEVDLNCKLSTSHFHFLHQHHFIRIFQYHLHKTYFG